MSTPDTALSLGQARRLMFARILMREAERHLERESVLVHGLALLSLQDAAETVLAVLADIRGAKMDRAFETSLQNVAAKVGGTLPQLGRMIALNRARVALKHHGVMPERAEVKAFADDVSHFISASLKDFAGIDFGSISLANLIRSLQVAREVRIADGLIAQDDYDGCARACARGIGRLLERIAQDPRWSSPRWTPQSLESVRALQRPDIRTLAEVVASTQDTVRQLQGVLGVMVSGLDMSSFWRFLAYAPEATNWTGRDVKRRPVKGVTAKQARFCLDYLIESALGFQEANWGFISPTGTSRVVATRSAKMFARGPDSPMDEPGDADFLRTAEVGEHLWARDHYLGGQGPGLIPVIDPRTWDELWIAPDAIEAMKDGGGGDST